MKVNIPPDLSMSLADPQLVTLFCQALFCGLISIKGSTGNEQWTLAEVGVLKALPLAAANPNDIASLKEALKKFALDLPCEPGLSQRTNPADHFGLNKADFLGSMHQACQERRQQQDFPQCSRQLIQDIETALKSKDDHVRALATVLKVEKDEPVWEHWNQMKS